MGDGADMALDNAFDDEDALYAYQSGRLSNSEAYDLGVIDERGQVPRGAGSTPVFSGLSTKRQRPRKALPEAPKGPGECPRCGAQCVPREGRFGPFWGCPRFPDCKGSRGA